VTPQYQLALAVALRMLISESNEPELATYNFATRNLKPKWMIQLRELAFELSLTARGDSLHHQKYQLMSQRNWQ
jgi:hypothetical protein